MVILDIFARSAHTDVREHMFMYRLCRLSLNVALKVQNLKYDARTHTAMLFSSSPQRVDNDVINTKLDSYDMLSVVVRICTVQGLLWYLQQITRH